MRASFVFSNTCSLALAFCCVKHLFAALHARHGFYVLPPVTHLHRLLLLTENHREILWWSLSQCGVRLKMLCTFIMYAVNLELFSNVCLCDEVCLFIQNLSIKHTHSGDRGILSNTIWWFDPCTGGFNFVLASWESWLISFTLLQSPFIWTSAKHLKHNLQYDWAPWETSLPELNMVCRVNKSDMCHWLLAEIVSLSLSVFFQTHLFCVFLLDWFEIST